MIDTHCHLNFPELRNQLDQVMEQAAEAGVTHFIVPGTSIESSRSAVVLSEQFPNIYAAVGLHPTDVTEYTTDTLSEMRTLLQGKGKLVAIGEVGLDYYHFEDCPTEEDKARRKELQAQVFIDFIGLAKEYSLPLIIHSRDAAADTVKILKEHAPKHPTVIHCFTGTMEEAKQFLEIGCFISFTGIITYRKNEDLRNVVQEVPLNQIMAETDAPFLPPEGHRGELGEPKFVRQVTECIAQVKGLKFEEVDSVTSSTAQVFFKLFS